MRRWEWVELGAVGLAVGLPVLIGQRLRKGRISVVLVSAVLAQTLLEGFRWQLVPLHLAAVVMAVTDFGWQGRRVAGWPRARRALLGVVGVGSLALLPVVLPIPDFPRPTGPFAVGTTTIVLTDPERGESYGRPDLAEGEDPPAEEELPRRRIVVQMWYPAVPEPDAEPAVWHPDWKPVGAELADQLGFPRFFLDHLVGVAGTAVVDAEPLSGAYPVIVYSHGWTGFRSIALDQMETLASEGYLVIAADHTYGAIGTVFPDSGEFVPFDPRALPDEGDPSYADAAMKLVATFADDVRLIIDTLEEGGMGSLGAHADMSRIGLFGHSTGGGAVVSVCLTDERCKAVAGLDAWVEPMPDRILAETPAAPSMFLRSAGWQGTPNDARLRGLVERSTAPVIWVGIDQANHNDFVMTPLLSPVAEQLGLKGPIPANDIVPLLHEFLDSFFDLALMGGGGATFNRTPPEGVSVERLVP